jgi:hypothetical protein
VPRRILHRNGIGLRSIAGGDAMIGGWGDGMME